MSTFKNHHQSKGFNCGTCEITDFIDAFKLHEIRESKNGDAFSLASFKSEQSRAKANIDYLGGIVIDIDSISHEYVPTLLSILKSYFSICYTTYSHRKDLPRLRVVLPTLASISVSEYPDFVRRVALFLGVQVDPCSLKAAQLYYMPSYAKENGDQEHFIQAVADRPCIDPRQLPRAPSGPTVGSLKSSGSPEFDEDQIAHADKVIADDFSSHVLTVAGEVFIYGRGIWTVITDDVLLRLLSQIPSVAATYKSVSQIEGLLRAIKMRTAVAAFPDATPNTLNVENGVLDLTGGDLDEHLPEHHHRNQLATMYSEEAECPRWLRFLGEVFDGDPDQQDKITFLQEWFGYLLVPSTQHQKMLWLLGAGANGKSVLLEVMQDMLGTQNTSSMMLNEMSQEFYRYELYGKLANFAGEHPAGARLNDGFIKSVVAGDSITANRKGRSPVQFRPYARLVAAMNELPALKDISHGFFRRLIVLTLNRTFTREEQDLNLSADLKRERAGILAWAVKGLLRLQQQGRFTYVSSSEDLCQQYRRNSDPVQMFLDDCVMPHRGPKTEKKVVYEAYRDYCAANGYVPDSNVTFGKQLKGKGITDASSNGRSFYNLGLRVDAACTTLSGGYSVTPKKRISLQDAVNDDDDSAA